MSLRIAPSSGHASSTNNTSTYKLNAQPKQSLDRGAPSAPGLPDTLRLSHAQTTSQDPKPSTTHPLESRLSAWQSTQSSLQNQLLRRNFGIALPLRIQMEQNMVRKADSFRPSVLGAPSRVHDDILSNRDASIQWEDIYAGQDGLRGIVDQGGDGQGLSWTEEMERNVGMGKW